MFKLDWAKWNAFHVGRDRRDGCIYLFRKETNAFASLSAFVPIFYFDQETLGL